MEDQYVPLVIAAGSLEAVAGLNLVSDMQSAAALLGYCVDRAVRDNMLKLRLGLDPATGTCTLHFYGPREYPPDRSDEKPIWWDMHGLGPDDYPLLFKYVVASTSFGAAAPMQGRLQAKRWNREVVLRVTLESLYSVELEWPVAELDAEQ